MTGVALAALLLTLALAGCGSTAAPAPARPTSGARVVEGGFYAPSIRGTEHFAAYLPKGYDSSSRRYPVIYALHGLPSDESGYQNVPIRSWGQDAEQAGRPAIVVAPQGARPGDSDPEWHDWRPGRDWDSVVADDVVHRVDRSYRTIADRHGRALIGMSAGGYGATLIAVHHPATFSVIQSWSGYFHPTNPQGTAPLDVGSPAGNAQASAHTYVPAVRDIYRDYRPTYFGFYIGDADSRFLAENERLHRELLEAGVPHVFAVYQGGHTGSFWAEHEENWIGAAVHELTPAAR